MAVDRWSWSGDGLFKLGDIKVYMFNDGSDPVKRKKVMERGRKDFPEQCH